MKRIIVLLFIVLAGYTVKAQPAAGKVFLGGDLGLSVETNKYKSGSTTTKNYTSTSIALLPQAGFFVSDKIAIGAQVGLRSVIYKYPDASLEKITNTTVVINPFARYYLISGTGGIFAEANMGIEAGKVKNSYNTNNTTEKNITTFSFGVAPGAYYYITPKIAIECKFGWAGFQSYIEKHNDNDKSITNDFGLNLNPSSLSLGITFTL
ncbi:MAG TPA: outer membrane beta-barrel protein [Bacteroidales bacterium]|nr:outer membrane beta-barrel protein [Bacteroidales bacterium]